MNPLAQTLSLFLLSLPTLATAADPATWPQWRGPTRDGQVKATPWPDRLAGKRLQPHWRVELGPSYSGPVVTGDRVFVTETRAGKEEVVRALDRATGKEAWKATWPGAMTVPFFARSNGSWIRATPAYEGDSLYVAGMRDVLVCLDARTGAERWRVDFLKRYKTPLPSFGFVCSPLVAGGGVYVQAGGSVVKLDEKTGKTLWRSLDDGGGMYGSAFSSPTRARLGGREQLLVQTRARLAGLDPATGKAFWSQEVPAFRGMNILTPTALGEKVFTSSYGGGSLCFTVHRAGAEWKSDLAWKLPEQGYMSTPVVVDGHAYLHLRNQRFACLDLREGKTRWITSRTFGKYWSLVANQDRILALDERGLLYLIRANPDKFELLDERRISDNPTWAHLAVCGEELFVRELNALAVYRWTKEGPKVPGGR